MQKGASGMLRLPHEVLQRTNEREERDGGRKDHKLPAVSKGQPCLELPMPMTSLDIDTHGCKPLPQHGRFRRLRPYSNVQRALSSGSAAVRASPKVCSKHVESQPLGNPVVCRK